MTGRTITVVLALAVGLPACHHGESLAVSSDPARPIYRNDAVSLASIQLVKIHFASVTTNNDQGKDLVQNVFESSLRTHLGRRFPKVETGDAATGASEAVLDANLVVNWGSRAARALVGFGAGRAGIEIKYYLRDSSGQLLAKLETVDTMSMGLYGGDSRDLVFSAAEKWNAWFVDKVLTKPGS